jgi:threonine dehydratase
LRTSARRAICGDGRFRRKADLSLRKSKKLISCLSPKGRALGLVLSGGNIDTRLLSGVLTRQLAREGRLSQLRFDIADRPGQLNTVVAVLSQAGANIVEVSHQRIFTDLPAKAVLLEVVIETRDRSHLASTIDALRAANVDVDVGGD